MTADQIAALCGGKKAKRRVAETRRQNEQAADTALRMIEQERCARLVDVMLEQKPWCDHLMARGALALAAHVIRRGRHLTATEKLKNLAAALDDGTKQGKRAADNIRRAIAG